MNATAISTAASSNATPPKSKLLVPHAPSTSPTRHAKVPANIESKMVIESRKTSRNAIPTTIIVSPVKRRVSGSNMTAGSSSTFIDDQQTIVSSLTTISPQLSSYEGNSTGKLSGNAGKSMRRSMSMDEGTNYVATGISPMIIPQIGLDSPRRPERRMSNVDLGSCNRNIDEASKKSFAPPHRRSNVPDVVRAIDAIKTPEGSPNTSPSKHRKQVESPRRPERQTSTKINYVAKSEWENVLEDRNKTKAGDPKIQPSCSLKEGISNNKQHKPMEILACPVNPNDKSNDAALQKNKGVLRRCISMDENNCHALQGRLGRMEPGHGDYFFAATRACSQSPRQPTRLPSVRKINGLAQFTGSGVKSTTNDPLYNQKRQRRYSCGDGKIKDVFGTNKLLQNLPLAAGTISSITERFEEDSKRTSSNFPFRRSPRPDKTNHFNFSKRNIQVPKPSTAMVDIIFNPSEERVSNAVQETNTRNLRLQKRRSTIDMLPHSTPPLSPQRKTNRNVHKNIVERRHHRRYSNPDDVAPYSHRDKHDGYDKIDPKTDLDKYGIPVSVEKDLCVYGSSSNSPRRRKNNPKQDEQKIPRQLSTSILMNPIKRRSIDLSAAKEASTNTNKLNGEQANTMENISGRMWLQSNLLNRGRDSLRNLFGQSNRFLNRKIDDNIVITTAEEKSHKNNEDGTFRSSTLSTDDESIVLSGDDAIHRSGNHRKQTRQQSLHFISGDKKDISCSEIPSNAALNFSSPSICTVSNKHHDQEQCSVPLFGNDSLALY